jgi:uncharacterized peroxidase-related enzyme
MAFPIHTRDTAPDGAKAKLAQVEKAFGFIPNLAGMLANAPVALEAYLAVAAAFGRSSLSAAEQQVTLLTTSVENECGYCVAAHSAIAASEGLPAEVVDAVRRRVPVADPKLEALRRFTHAVVTRRGWVEDELPAFYAAGFNQANALEVITGVTQKILSNYANHIAETPVDDAFVAHRWETAA